MILHGVIRRISLYRVSCSRNLGTHKYYLGRWRSYVTKSDEHLVWDRNWRSGAVWGTADFTYITFGMNTSNYRRVPSSPILWKLPTFSDSAEVSRTCFAAAVLKQTCFPKETAAEMLKMGVSEMWEKLRWFLTIFCMKVAIEWELLKYIEIL